MKKWHIAVMLSAVFIIGGTLSWLIWILGGGRETFGPLNSYFFISLSIIIATAAAASSAISSVIASESLKLTRATQRPFLNIYQFHINWSRNDGRSTLVNNFIFGFCNTGAFPADKVSVLIKVNKEKMDNQQHLFAVSEGIPPICFPNGETTNLDFREVDEKKKLEVELKDKLKVRIEIEYNNKLTHETYKTNRSYLVQYDPTAPCAPTILPEEDYWD